jgi:hypothetical protein
MDRMHPLASAINRNDMNALKQLVTPDNINVQMTAWAPLARASYYKRHDMMLFLIARGADLDFVDGDDYTPLVASVVKNDLIGTRILLRAGVSTALGPIQERIIVKSIEANDVGIHYDIIHLIIRHGARFVTYDVPQWVCDYQVEIERARTSVVTLLGVWRLRRPLVTVGLDQRLMAEVAKLVWSMR